MKKIISVILLSCMLATVSVNCYAKDTIRGEVLNTDIKAYINGNPIKSYNINGWTGIKAEDLREYGFNVEWNSDERTLSIIKNPTEKCTANYQFELNDCRPIGSRAAYVYKTDIKTFLEGKPVESFNIGGWTIIYIDELQIYGDVIWDSQKREISYRSTIPWQINLMPYYMSSQGHAVGSYDDVVKNINGIFTKENNIYYADGENLGHICEVKLTYDKEQGGLIFSFSMTGQHLIHDEYLSNLCNSMITVENGTRIQDSPTFANKHVRLCINGILVPICEVWQNKGNNNKDFYFLLDFKIRRDEVNNITFEFF